MPTTSLGIPYPSSSDDAELWDHFQALANSVNTLLGQRKVMQSGTTAPLTISNGSNNVSTTVTFSTPFASVPNVTATVNSGAGALISSSIRITAVSTTSVTFSLTYPTNSGSAVTATLSWIATVN